MSFNPSSIDVKVGDTVEWTNNDVREHNVTAKDGSFSSSNLGPGKSYRQTFKKAGKFSYGCSLHPRMKGTVNVSGTAHNGAFAQLERAAKNLFGAAADFRARRHIGW
jgi:hypothetical protein